MSQISQPQYVQTSRPEKANTIACAVLVYNLVVILWGAVVRATGSGAGCGSHWPTCNGEVIPLEPSIKTMIEFSHRLTSGLALVFVVFLWWFFRKTFAKGHPARSAANWSFLFIVTEALIGAGIVLLRYVALDRSVGRVFSQSLHLVNTFFLLAALTRAWLLSNAQLAGPTKVSKWLPALKTMLLLVAVAGAITALGDTLFPAQSLAEGMAQDFSAFAHFLVRLRIIHPVLASVVSLFVVVVAASIGEKSANARAKKLARVMVGLYLAQLLCGGINLLLLAPVWMQIVHLLLADLVWISFIAFETRLRSQTSH